MATTITAQARTSEEAETPLKDWFLLPLLVLLTIGSAVAATLWLAHRVFTESRPFVQACLEPGASWSGSRAIPNSVCWDKKYESQWVEYRFNGCGHRTQLNCGTKPPGVYRIVLTGSSVAMGHLIAENRIFAVLLPDALGKETDRKIEVYNEGMVGLNPHVVVLRFDDALAAKPDLVLWTLTAWDIQNTLPPEAMPAPDSNAGSLAKAWFRIKSAVTSKSALKASRALVERYLIEGQKRFDDSPVAALLQHVLFKNRNQYIRSSLMAGDSVGYLQTQMSQPWQSRLREFDRDFGEIEDRASRSHVRVVVVLVPSRIQAALVAAGGWPPGVDPYELDRRLRRIVEAHGGTYLNMLEDMKKVRNPELGYFSIDGHPNIAGHAMISQLLTKELTSGIVPDLEARTSKTDRKQGM
jgi:hypothetical protein